ncbi:hypothetical protein EYR97_03010 [Alteromonas sp. KUL42]|uniref:hypothetical protein n=1 Tax=Alteromonas sp. KUL42 TaxID=2480797 RepID=UPI000791D86C|nr:hypothetical protein [Alteromonas sp. KUL42]KXJ58308.1 MAG: hypothetical protein AXW14_06590 [Alteromonas sp. Nap_26]TAP37442.1 hypothetical protein EYR97_03010 [Alteromonas sp. KUL42]
MKKFFLLIMMVVSTSVNATSNSEVDDYCLDFGMLMGALIITKANGEPIDLSAVVQRGKMIANSYGTPNFQSWAGNFSTTIIRKIAKMPYSEVHDIYNQNQRDLVQLTASFKHVCRSQIN